MEIEWAATLTDDPHAPHRFGFLQIRPLTLTGNGRALAPADLDDPAALVATEIALGNGAYPAIHDVVYVAPGRFDRGATMAVAAEVAQFNTRLKQAGRPYLLIGPGRWGSSDRWLGIPVRWEQISGAQVIVETDLTDFKVTPSEGTHFFQNLTSFQVGYLTVNEGRPHTVCHWERLESLPAVTEGRYVRHVRLEAPLEVVIDGKSRRGIVRFSGPES